MLTGHDHGPLLAALQAARLFSAAAAAASVLLVAGLAYRLAPYARLRRRQWLTVLVAVIAALDPVLVRYGRQVMIEPFALVASLLVLHTAWSLRNRNFEYVWAVVAPVERACPADKRDHCFHRRYPCCTHALLQRDRALFRRSLAAFGIGLGFMSLWFLWAVEIGIGSTFIAYNTVTLERLVGLVQITGYNASGLLAGVGHLAFGRRVLRQLLSPRGLAR